MPRELSNAELNKGRLVIDAVISLSLRNPFDLELKYIDWTGEFPSLSHENSFSFLERFSPEKSYNGNLEPILTNYYIALRKSLDRLDKYL